MRFEVCMYTTTTDKQVEIGKFDFDALLIHHGYSTRGF